MSTNITLYKTVYTPKQLPLTQYPQAAVAGRSNVGKSSLINILANRNKLAKISSTPGKTRSINFYWIQSSKFYLVDLPGYGYAKCSKQQRQSWARLMDTYLKEAKTLKGVILLLDARIPPQELDLQFIEYIKHLNINILPILTKADKINLQQKNKVQNSWRDLLDPYHKVFLFTSKSKQSQKDLWKKILEMINT